jgi:phage terminase small subunit
VTYRQRLFAFHYLGAANGNATEAARLAGYSYPNSRTARLLADPEIQEAIQAGLAEVAMTAQEVLARLSDEAAGLPEECLNDNGTIDIKKLKEMGLSHLVKKSIMTGEGIRVELYDAQAAKVHLGRHHKLWVDQLNMTDTTDIKQLSIEQLRAITEGRPIGPLRVAAPA